jgi:2-amino-4-hydroxy-6-hydroxymethyldihydropteridine diphosphokinase
LSAAGTTETEAGHLYALGLGSNVAPENNLPQAVRRLAELLLISAVSTAWESPAVIKGGAAQDSYPDFINAALLARSPLPPHLLKQQVIRHVEAQLGRTRSADKFAPRTIDIDILVVDGQPLENDLWHYAYLALPLAELLPDLADPASGETLAQAAARLRHTVPIHPRLDIVLG